MNDKYFLLLVWNSINFDDIRSIVEHWQNLSLLKIISINAHVLHQACAFCHGELTWSTISIPFSITNVLVA